MSIISIGKEGLTLGEIIESLGEKDYEMIEIRCKTKENGDLFYGLCEYRDGELLSSDGDAYSLDDRYVEWEEYENEDIESDYEIGATFLTVWSKE